MNANDRYAPGTESGQAGPQSWYWLLLGLATVGTASTPLLLATSSTAATVAIEGPSLIVFLVLLPLARRPGARFAGPDLDGNRRAVSFLVSMVAAGSILISAALRHHSVGGAAALLAAAALAVLVTVLLRLRRPA